MNYYVRSFSPTKKSFTIRELLTYLQRKGFEVTAYSQIDDWEEEWLDDNTWLSTDLTWNNITLLLFQNLLSDGSGFVKKEIQGFSQELQTFRPSLRKWEAGIMLQHTKQIYAIQFFQSHAFEGGEWKGWRLIQEILRFIRIKTRGLFFWQDVLQQSDAEGFFINEKLVIAYPPINVAITYFVHGKTTDNEEGRATGWNPGELSKRGIDEAKKLGAIVERKFDAFFCSDLKRAVDSATLGFAHAYRIIQDQRLRECNYGDMNGVNEPIVNIQEHIDTPFPNGESQKDVEKRMRDFLQEIAKKYSGKHIAILAHRSPQLALEVILNKKTWGQAIREDWRHTQSWQPGWNYVLIK